MMMIIHTSEGEPVFYRDFTVSLTLLLIREVILSTGTIVTITAHVRRDTFTSTSALKHTLSLKMIHQYSRTAH